MDFFRAPKFTLVLPLTCIFYNQGVKKKGVIYNIIANRAPEARQFRPNGLLTHKVNTQLRRNFECIGKLGFLCVRYFTSWGCDSYFDSK